MPRAPEELPPQEEQVTVMANFADLAELKRAQKAVADASVSIGQQMVDADAAYSKPWFGPGRDQYLAAQNIKQTLQSWFGAAREFVTTGAIEGKPATKEQAANLLKGGARFVNDYAQALKTSMQYAPSAIAGRALGNVAERLFGIGNDMFDAAESILTATTTTLKWLPWLIAGAIVIPFGIKVYLAKKRGGTDAALEAAGSGISAGRERAFSAAKRAGSAIKKAVVPMSGYRFVAGARPRRRA